MPDIKEDLESIDVVTLKDLVETGHDDKFICRLFGLTPARWRGIQERNPNLRIALDKWKQVAKSRVERSLFERATGYDYETVKIFCNSDGEVTEVPYTEHVPPDVGAIKYWLNNQAKDEWQERQNLSIGAEESFAKAIARARERMREVEPSEADVAPLIEGPKDD